MRSINKGETSLYQRLKQSGTFLSSLIPTEHPIAKVTTLQFLMHLFF
jgi:hypothetical protein